mmetsp:Transcript_10767/g.37699  ORF Transcript_10767/g.37699 Transcript_10767/m.37699 type:complete len:847 (-) Transcript_10767:275-2815(-)
MMDSPVLRCQPLPASEAVELALESVEVETRIDDDDDNSDVSPDDVSNSMAVTCKVAFRGPRTPGSFSEELPCSEGSGQRAVFPDLLPGMRVRLVAMENVGLPSLERKEAFLLSQACADDSGLTWLVRVLDGSGLTLEVKARHLIPDANGHRGHTKALSPRGISKGSNQNRSGEDAGPKRSFSSFIESEHDDQEYEHMSCCRRRCSKVLSHSMSEASVGFVIIANFILIVIETDYKAEFADRPGEDGPEWVQQLMDVCYLFFLTELLLRCYVERLGLLRHPSNIMDAAIIVLGSFEYILAWAGAGLQGFGIVRVARMIRLIRLARVLRLFTVLKELRRLIQMMGGCFKTLLWSCLLLLLVMTIFSVVAVELINPIVQRLAEEGTWVGCNRCGRSFSSTFMANLTFFQTVVAGDSWGYIAVAVIEEAPWTAVPVFVGSLLILVFGVLNLIVAVIVDTFAEGRENDVTSKAIDMELQEKQEKALLAKMFQQIDHDGNGALSLDEMKEGAKKVTAFRHWLRVMDIDRHDLRQLFLIVDEDGSGEIDPDEFIEAMFRMKNSDTKSATKFVKHMVTRMDISTKDMHSDLTLSLSSLANTLGRTVNDMDDQKVVVKAEFDRHKTVVETALEKNEERLARWVETEAAIQKKLEEQESAIQRVVKDAMNKASEEALEAALKAAAEAAREVIVKSLYKSNQLALLLEASLPQMPPSKPAFPSQDLWGLQFVGTQSLDGQSARADGRPSSPSSSSVGGSRPFSADYGRPVTPPFFSEEGTATSEGRPLGPPSDGRHMSLDCRPPEARGAAVAECSSQLGHQLVGNTAPNVPVLASNAISFGRDRSFSSGEMPRMLAD